MQRRTSSKKSGTGSTPPTGDQKLPSPSPASPCSVSKTARNRHGEEETAAIKKPRTDDIISSATRPTTEDGVENPIKDNLQSSDTPKGPQSSSATQLQVQIIALS